MSPVQVRPATLRDAKAIATIHCAAWQTTLEKIIPHDHLRTLSVEKRQAYWREAIDFCEPQVHVATDAANKVVGFVAYDRSRDKGTPPSCGEIWAIYVEPSKWATGVGLALWDAARDGLKEEGCTKVTVWAHLRNERAMRFLEVAGFKREMNTAKTTEINTVRLEEMRLHRDVN